MKRYELELNLSFLSLMTVLLYVCKVPVYALIIIYFLLFIYFLLKRKPIYYYIITILFSVMCNHYRGSVILVDYNLILFLLCIILYQCFKERKFIKGILFIPLLLLLIYSLITLLWTPNKYMGIEGVFAMLEGYLMYFIITNSKLEKINTIVLSKIASFLLLTLTLEITSLYITHGIYEVIENKNLLHLGWAMSNIVATIYVLLIPIMLYKYLKKKYFIFYIIIDIMSLIGLLLTLSRGAYLGVFVSIMLFSLYLIRKKIIIYVGVFISILSSILLLIQPIRQIIISYVTHHNLLDASNRDHIYALGWRSFQNHLLFGQGVKSSEWMIEIYLKQNYSHYHNFVLQIAATLGLVGLILFVYIIYHWIKILDDRMPFVRCVAFAVIGATVHQLFDVSFDLYFFGVYFYLLIGLVEFLRKKDLYT